MNLFPAPLATTTPARHRPANRSKLRLEAKDAVDAYSSSMPKCLARKSRAGGRARRGMGVWCVEIARVRHLHCGSCGN